MSPQTTRREFMATSAAIGAAVWVGHSSVRAEEKSPNSKVRYACIGIGGKGKSDSSDAASFGEIVAICDIDDRNLKKASVQPGFEHAEQFSDFEEMLTKLGDKIDAVTVSTPDHTHAPAAAMAMKMKKATFCQKPLTHTVWEARRLQQIAKETGVATQMGNQGTANDALRHAAALLKQGILGKIKEVHVATNRPVWPQGGPRPEPAEAPPWIHWEEWLGPAPERPYAEGYHPFAWRGWWDFGTGALGDMACHTFNMPFAGLNLANPKTIQAWCTGHNRDSYPQASKIQFEFANPTGDGLLPVWWYDGGNEPPESLLNGAMFEKVGGKVRGSIIVGEDLVMYAVGDYSEKVRLLDKEGKEVPLPAAEYEKSPGHFAEFHEAITGKRKEAMSNFVNYAGPLTETILLGNLAVYDAAEGAGRKIEWDSEAMKATNAPEVQHIVKKQYRGDWGKYLEG
ncbi:Gfo/Idh/MocA family protein [Planctomicrobium piriforme]|uniref:Predicted dehydrogenase n=1 Tax=Planctomicrobium piriforme TaxID=1576369 RepID=A0A1I3PH28_9PLAN|nr:Gfo/Idh/MocA family oxidoreductase [Planctomicrobium piriforme]SFJ20984.1 Predicted dehydrogenase [Planctomicrobium piriforme]